MAIKNLVVRGGADFSGIKREMDKTQKVIGNFQTNVTSAMKKVGVALAAIGLGKIIKDSITAASELEGAFLGLQSIVEGQGRSFSKAKGFINEYINDGLVPLTDAVKAYKNLASRGYDDEQIKQTMNSLKDAAAFGRQSGLTLGEAVASATEGLKNENSLLVDNAGVTKNVAKMWEDYAKSIGTTAKKLTQQQKIQAEVNGIMRETQFQVGDAAKYADTYAGRLAHLNKTLGDIQVNIGQAFMPIANFVVPLLQKLANWLSKVTAYMKYFMQALFGVKAIQSQVGAAAGDATTAQEDYGKATEGAGKKVKKAAKEAKGSLAGFDEINSLADKAESAGDADGSGGAAGGVGGAGFGDFGDFGMPEIDTDAIPAKIQAMADSIKSKFQEMQDNANGFGSIFAEVFSGIGDALQPLYDAVDPIKQSLAEIGVTFLQWKDGVLVPILSYLLLNFIPSIVTGFVKDFAPVFANVAVWSVELLAKTFKNATDMMVSLWNGTWLPSLERIKNAWVDGNTSIANSLQSLWNGTIKPLVDYLLNSFILPIAKKVNEVLVPIFTDILVVAFKETGKTFEWLANLMNDIYRTVIEPVFELIKKIVMDTLDVVKNLWEEHGQTLLGNLSELFEGIGNTFQKLWDEILDPIITPFLEMLTELWNKHLKGLVEEIGKFVMVLVNAALDIFNKFILPLVNFLIDTLGPTFAKIFKFIAEVVGNNIGAVIEFAKGLLKMLGGVIDFIAGIFTNDWSRVWTGIVSIFEGIVTMISGVFKGVLNNTIAIINAAIEAVMSGINSLIQGAIDLINAVPGIDIKVNPIPVPKIPKLARGGIVDGATNFGNYIAGEAGAEMIVPLENTPFVDKLAGALGSAVMAAMQMGGSQSNGSDGGDVVIQLDGTTLARVLKPFTDRENSRLGSTIIQPI